METDVWDLQEMSVEVVHIHQSLDSQNERNNLPDIERCEKHKEQEGES